MRRSSKSKQKGPDGFVIGEEAIVDDAFRTEQPSGSGLPEEADEDRFDSAAPGGGAESPAAPRKRGLPRRTGERQWRTSSSSDAPTCNAFVDDDDEEDLSGRSFRDTPPETDELPPAPVSRRTPLAEPDDEELVDPSRRPPLIPVDEGPAEDSDRGRECGGSSQHPSRSPRRGGGLVALSSLRRKRAGERKAKSEQSERKVRPRLDERERRGLAAAGVVALLVAVIALSGALKGGGEEDQSGSGRADRAAQLQDQRAERRADRRADRRAERIAERRRERLAARRSERREAREAQEAERVESTPAPVETAPVTAPVPAPVPAPDPAPAPAGGDNIAGNEWGP